MCFGLCCWVEGASFSFLPTGGFPSAIATRAPSLEVRNRPTVSTGFQLASLWPGAGAAQVSPVAVAGSGRDGTGLS